MADVPVLAQIAQYGPMAVIAAAAVLFVFRAWNGVPAFMAQLLEIKKAAAAEKAADWTRLRDEIIRLDQRFRDERERSDRRQEAQELENEKCRRDLAELRDEHANEKAERVRLERLMLAEGEIRQAGASAAAEARADAADKAKGEGK